MTDKDKEFLKLITDMHRDLLVVTRILLLVVHHSGIEFSFEL